MAVAFDNSSESHTGTTGSTSAASFNWSHISIGTPRGLLVFTFTNANADDATAVDINGVSLTAVSGGRAVDTATEPGDCKAWFLGANVPTGTQTITVTRNNNANVMYAVGISVTGNADTEVYTSGIVLAQTDGTLAEVNVTDGSPGTNSVRFAAINSGLAAVPAAGANSTISRGIDFGARVIQVARETTAGQGSRPVGFSSGTSDDRAAVYLAVRENPNISVATGLGALSLAGFAPTVTATNHQQASPGTGLLTAAGLAPTVSVTNPNVTVDTATAAVLLAGYAPTVQLPVAVSPNTGVGVLAGLAPSVTATDHQTVTAGVGAASLTGFAPTATATDHQTVATALGLLTLTGQAPTVTASDHQTVAAGVGALAATGHAPTSTASDHQTVAAALGQLTIAGFAPDVLSGTTATTFVGTAVLTGHAPTVTISQHATAVTQTGGLTLVGFAPTVSIPTVVLTDVGAVALAGHAPTVSAAAHQTATPGAGLLLLAGYAPAVSVAGLGPVSVTPGVGALVLTGYAPTAGQRINSRLTARTRTPPTTTGPAQRHKPAP